MAGWSASVRDGKLYLGLGDGHVYGIVPLPTTSQDSTTLLGKIIRIDVDAPRPTQIPPDNPFVGRPGWRGEIWQLGLRNPWRWSFDRGTGDLWVGDVGEDLHEEINFLPAATCGGNQSRLASAGGGVLLSARQRAARPPA